MSNSELKQNETQTTDKENFLSLAQASKLTGYHQDYLGQIARTGKLDAKKFGRNWFTTKAAIDKFLGRDELVQTSVAVQIETEEVFEPASIKITAVQPKVFVEPVVQVPSEPVLQTSGVAEENFESDQNLVFVKIFRNHEGSGPNVQDSLINSVEPALGMNRDVVGENRNIFLRHRKALQKYSRQRNHVTANSQTEVAGKNNSRFWNRATGTVAVGVVLVAAAIYFYETSLTPSTSSQIAGAATSAVGHVSVPAGQTQLFVPNENVTPDSVLMLTLKSEYNGRYWIGSQVNGKFSINLSESDQDQILFDYWIVD